MFNQDGYLQNILLILKDFYCSCANINQEQTPQLNLRKFFTFYANEKFWHKLDQISKPNQYIR